VDDVPFESTWQRKSFDLKEALRLREKASAVLALQRVFQEPKHATESILTKPKRVKDPKNLRKQYDTFQARATISESATLSDQVSQHRDRSQTPRCALGTWTPTLAWREDLKKS